MAAPQLSIVLPAYNESRRIARCIEDLTSFMKILPMDWEAIIVIEKSSDDTVEKARTLTQSNPHFKIIANQVKKGKGYAVKTGMLQARGDIVFFMDVDLSTPLVELIHFLAHFESHPGIDVLIGNRKHRESKIIKSQHQLRKKMGEIFNFFVQKIALKGIQDTQCGFKAFRKRAVLPIFERLSTNGFAFDVEVLLLAEALGYKIQSLPVKWINSTESKVHIVRDSLKMLLELLRIRHRVNQTLLISPPANPKDPQ